MRSIDAFRDTGYKGAVLPAPDPTASKSDSRLRFDQRILLLALASGFPAALVALILLWTGDYTPKVQWTLTVFVVGEGSPVDVEFLLGSQHPRLAGDKTG